MAKAVTAKTRELKWISPLVSGLFAMPAAVVAELIGKIAALANKYASTFEEVETQIKDSEKALCALLDELDENE